MNTCATCRHFTRSSLRGFGSCKLMPPSKWERISGYFPCRFAPSRWQEQQ